MSKRKQQQYQDLRELQNAGVEVTGDNTIKFNAGGSSETVKHIVAKTLVTKLGLVNGYLVDTECQVKHGEIDVLLHSHPDRLTLAVEVETSPTEETKQDKLSRYVHQQPAIDDMILVNVTDMPMDMLEALDYVSNQTGLTL